MLMQTKSECFHLIQIGRAVCCLLCHSFLSRCPASLQHVTPRARHISQDQEHNGRSSRPVIHRDDRGHCLKQPAAVVSAPVRPVCMHGTTRDIIDCPSLREPHSSNRCHPSYLGASQVNPRSGRRRIHSFRSIE